MFKFIYLSSAVIFQALLLVVGAIPQPEPQTNTPLHTYVVIQVLTNFKSY